MVVEVDADDRVRRHPGRELDDVQADAARAEHGDAFADAQFGVVVDDTHRGRHRATQQRARFGVEVRRDFGHAILGNDGTFAERGHPAGVDFRKRFRGVDRRRRLQTRPFAPMADNAVAGFDRGDAFARLQDDSGRFVAEEVGQEFVRAFGAFDFVDLRATDSAADDPDQHLAEAKRRGFDFLDHQRLLQFNENGGFEFHSK